VSDKALRASLRLLACVVLVGALLVQVGCFSVDAVDPSDRPLPFIVEMGGVDIHNVLESDAPRESHWPARWGERGGVKGVIVEEKRPLRGLVGVRTSRAMVLRADAEDVRDAVALSRFGGTDLRARFEGRGSLLLAEPERFRPPWRGDEDDVVKPEDPEPASVFRFVSGVEAGGVGPVPRVELQRTWMAWYEPDALDGGVECRTAIVLPGLFGAPRGLIGRMVGELLDDGWCVLRVMAPPSRYMERVEVELPAVLFTGDDEDGVESRGAAIDAVGRELARVFDDRFAEYAYAAEAGVRHISATRRPVGRVALVGMSGGVWATTALASRIRVIDGADIEAVVLLGGGVDALSAGLGSTYVSKIGVLAFTRDGAEVSAAVLSQRVILELVAAYVKASRLEVLKTTPAFGLEPVLVIDAAWDRIVPAKNGELLWLVTGQQERWTMRAGHLGLFFALPWFDGRLADWLDAAVPAADDAG
jgi:hypothetical protein